MLTFGEVLRSVDMGACIVCIFYACTTIVAAIMNIERKFCSDWANHDVQEALIGTVAIFIFCALRFCNICMMHNLCVCSGQLDQPIEQNGSASLKHSVPLNGSLQRGRCGITLLHGSSSETGHRLNCSFCAIIFPLLQRLYAKSSVGAWTRIANSKLGQDKK